MFVVLHPEVTLYFWLLWPMVWRQLHAQLEFEHWVPDGPPWPKTVGFCDLLGTPYAPGSKIPSVNSHNNENYTISHFVRCRPRKQFLTKMYSGSQQGMYRERIWRKFFLNFEKKHQNGSWLKSKKNSKHVLPPVSWKTNLCHISDTS